MSKGNPYFRAAMERDGPQLLDTLDWPEAKPGVLAGKKLLVTGIMETIERKDLEDLIKKCGGGLMTTVSPKLTYLVVGRDGKQKKCRHIPIININFISRSEET